MNQVTPIGGFSSAGADQLRQMSENSEQYTKFLKFQGRVFKHHTSIALEFFAQHPEAEFIAERRQWERLHYTIKAGTSGIRFVDQNGSQAEYYELSQTEENKKPYIWSLNKQNAGIVKKELGIFPQESILTGTLRQMNIPEVKNCMTALHIPPQNMQTFRKSFMEAVKVIMAGRLENGGNMFNLTADSSVFQSLRTEEEKMTFLSYAAKTARQALMKIETAVRSVQERNRMQNQPEPEQKKTDTLEELQNLVRISVAITMKEKEFTAIFHESGTEKSYDKLSALAEEIADLKQEYQALSQRIKKQEITKEDIALLSNAAN